MRREMRQFEQLFAGRDRPLKVRLRRLNCFEVQRHRGREQTVPGTSDQVDD
jgi:hypothetical protein